MADAKDEVKQVLNIAEVISDYVPLKRSGTGFLGICPFHGEKTPSFHVSPEKQIWHCFGCSQGGDVFSFVMQMEGVEFAEALRLLAKRAGVEIPRFSSSTSQVKQRLIAANEFAAKVYRRVLLTSPQAEAARAYVVKRGISDTLSEKFGLGYAPDAWETLASVIASRGGEAAVAETAGLLSRKKSGSGYVDRFRHRLLIPLRDVHGSVVGFTGRSLGEEMPKYLNSPETPVYHKGELLFGLDVGKRAIQKAKQVIVVEGNVDVIASHKAGVEEVVASSGTALTLLQLKLLARFTDTILFALDQDAAGFEAVKRAARLARQEGFTVKAVTLPPEAGKDPDEVVQKNPELWKEAVAHPIPFLQFLIDRALRDRDPHRIEDKMVVLKMLLPEIAVLPDAVERDHWVGMVADRLHVDRMAVRADLEKERAAQVPASSQSPKGASPPSPKGIPPTAPSRLDRTLKTLLALFLQETPAREQIHKDLPTDRLPEPWQTLYKLLRVAYGEYTERHPPLSFFAFLEARESLSPEQRAHFEALAIFGESLETEKPEELSSFVSDLIHAVHGEYLRGARFALEASIRQAEQAGDRERVEQLMHEYQRLRL